MWKGTYKYRSNYSARSWSSVGGREADHTRVVCCIEEVSQVQIFTNNQKKKNRSSNSLREKLCLWPTLWNWMGYPGWSIYTWGTCLRKWSGVGIQLLTPEGVVSCEKITASFDSIWMANLCNSSMWHWSGINRHLSFPWMNSMSWFYVNPINLD